jgi:16S rRNA G966 N2-methylase RsmD
MMSVQKFVRLAPRSYDIMYADPPFPMEGKEKLSLSIAQSQLLRPDGLYIIHYPAEDNLPERMGKLMCSDTRKYGRSMLKFYREDTHEQL